MTGHGSEEPVHVDLAQTLGQGYVLLRGETLLAEEQHAEVRMRLKQVGRDRVREWPAEIDPADECTQRRTRGFQFQRRIAQLSAPVFGSIFTAVP